MRAARAASIGAWALQVPLALLITGGGAAKLLGEPAMVDMFEQIGAGTYYVLAGLLIAGWGYGLAFACLATIVAASGLVFLFVPKPVASPA